MQRDVMKSGAGAQDLDLRDLWRAVWKRRHWIVLTVGLATSVTIVVSLLLPKFYKATAVLLPIGKGGGGAGGSLLSGQLGGMAAMMGLGGGGPSQQFMALLKTRTLAESIILTNDLLPVLLPPSDKAPSMEDAVGMLHQLVKFEEDKKAGTILIHAEMRAPELAVTVAESYVTGLQQFLANNALTVAKRNRIFIEQQLEQNKQDLLEGGKSLNNFYKEGKVSSIDPKVDVMLGNEGTVARGTSEIESLQRQKSALEKFLIVRDVPQRVYLQYMILHGKLTEQIHGLLAQQYAAAKIEESKEDLAFQVIDPPRLPGRKSRPRRTFMVLGALVGSFVLSTLAVALYGAADKREC